MTCHTHIHTYSYIRLCHHRPPPSVVTSLSPPCCCRRCDALKRVGQPRGRRQGRCGVRREEPKMPRLRRWSGDYTSRLRRRRPSKRLTELRRQRSRASRSADLLVFARLSARTALRLSPPLQKVLVSDGRHHRIDRQTTSKHATAPLAPVVSTAARHGASAPELLCMMACPYPRHVRRTFDTYLPRGTAVRIRSGRR